MFYPTSIGFEVKLFWCYVKHYQNSIVSSINNVLFYPWTLRLPFSWKEQKEGELEYCIKYLHSKSYKLFNQSPTRHSAGSYQRWLHCLVTINLLLIVSDWIGVLLCTTYGNSIRFIITTHIGLCHTLRLIATCEAL